MAIKRQMDPETHYPIIINALLHPLLFVVYSFLMTSQLDRCTPATPFPYAYQGQRQRGAGEMGISHPPMNYGKNKRLFPLFSNFEKIRWLYPPPEKKLAPPHNIRMLTRALFPTLLMQKGGLGK